MKALVYRFEGKSSVSNIYISLGIVRSNTDLCTFIEK
jgi:hypothetical protein